MIGISRRIALLRTVAVAAAGLAGLPSSAQEASWQPEKAVELVIGTSPGGSMDRLARFAEGWLKAHELIPDSSVVLNKPGGGHAVALNYVKDHAGDPHYLAAENTLMLTNHLLGRSPIRHTEFTPVAILYEEPMMFAVRADSEIADGEDLAARLQEDPQSVSFSVSSGVGTANHVAVVMLAQAIGVDPKQIRAVSFDSGGDGITATLGGHVDVVVTPPGSLMQFIEDGQLRFVAVAGEERAGGPLADVPTWSELGYDAVVSAWRGIVAPPNLPAEAVAYWENAFQGMIESSEFAAEAEENYFTARFLGSEEAGAFLERMEQQFEKYLEDIGAT